MRVGAVLVAGHEKALLLTIPLYFPELLRNLLLSVQTEPCKDLTLRSWSLFLDETVSHSEP